MGQFGLIALHTTDQDVWYGAFSVESVAQLSIYPLEYPVLLFVPDYLEIIEFLQLHQSNPSIKMLGIS